MRMRGAQPATMDPKDWMDELSSRLRHQLLERVEAWERNDTLVPPVEEVLEQVKGLLPPAEPSALAQEIGTVYDTSAVMKVLGGVSRQAVEDRRKKHNILALKTKDRSWVYPTFQFEDGSVDPRLRPAIQALGQGPAWSVALWFCTPNPDLEDLTPLQWARSDRPVEGLLASALRTAHEWGVPTDRPERKRPTGARQRRATTAVTVDQVVAG